MGFTRRDLARDALLVVGGTVIGASSVWLPHALGPRRLPLDGGYAPAAGAPAAVHHPQVTVTWFVDTDEPVVAFTFDDGPHPPWTPLVLDVLDEHRPSGA